jgi:hypothetical protein
MRKINVLGQFFVSGAAVIVMGAMGCGLGAGNSSVTSDEAALAETQSESNDTASAGMEAGDDELSKSMPANFDYVRVGRPGIGLAIRALAHGVYLCAGQETITFKDKTADCANIGLNGQYRGGATITFNQCKLPWGGSLDGTVDVNVEKQLSPGATCGAGAMIDVDRELTINQLTWVRPSGVRVEYSNIAASAKATRPIATIPTDISLNVSGERQVYDAQNKLILDHLLNSSATVASALGAQPSLTLDGTATLVHKLANYTATLTAVAVERVPGCCAPVSGQIKVERTGTVNNSRTWDFGPSCGDITVDGHPYSVDCE